MIFSLLKESDVGMMGSGKTTAARILAKAMKFHLLEENFGENAFLSRFYADMKRWAFHSQTFFLMEKITQMLETSIPEIERRIGARGRGYEQKIPQTHDSN